MSTTAIRSRIGLTCEDVRLELAAYVKGALPLHGTQQIFRHLRRCVSCRAAAEGQQVIEHEMFIPFKKFAVGFAITATTVIGSTLIFSQQAPQAQATLAPPAPALAPAPIPAPIRRAVSPAPKSEAFAAKPGTAYYIRLRTPDPAHTENLLEKMLSRQAAVVDWQGPYSGRYYLTFTPRQLAIFTDGLGSVGVAQVKEVGERKWYGEGPAMPDACSATLDLISG